MEGFDGYEGAFVIAKAVAFRDDQRVPAVTVLAISDFEFGTVSGRGFASSRHSYLRYVFALTSPALAADWDWEHLERGDLLSFE